MSSFSGLPKSLRASSPARQYARLGVEVLEDRVVPSATPTHLYTFSSGLEDSYGGPSLLADGGSVADGRYTFAPNQSLRLVNGLEDVGTYSVALSMEVDSLSPTFKKLLDFSGQSDDNGLYLTDSYLQLYPGGMGMTPIGADTEFQFVLTRDGATGVTSLYLNGVLEQVYGGDAAVPFTNVLTFFADDSTTGFSEAVGGSVDFIAVYSQVLSQADALEIFVGATTLSADEPAVAVDEGGAVTNGGSWSDANFETVSLTASVGTVTQNADGAWSWSFTPNDGPGGSQTVTITASTASGSVSTSFELVVNNVAPTVTALTATAGAARGDVNLSGAFADAGLLDTHTVTVNWGDGSGIQTLSNVDQVANLFAAGHHYAGSGVFTIMVTVTDSDGGVVTATTSAIVAGAGVSLVNGTLFVTGTPGADLIRIDAVTRPAKKKGARREVIYVVTTVFNIGSRRPTVKISTFKAADVDKIVLSGGGGRDKIFVAKGVNVDIFVDDGKILRLLRRKR